MYIQVGDRIRSPGVTRIVTCINGNYVWMRSTSFGLLDYSIREIADMCSTGKWTYIPGNSKLSLPVGA